MQHLREFRSVIDNDDYLVVGADGVVFKREISCVLRVIRYFQTVFVDVYFAANGTNSFLCGSVFYPKNLGPMEV